MKKVLKIINFIDKSTYELLARKIALKEKDLKLQEERLKIEYKKNEILSEGLKKSLTYYNNKMNI